VKGTILLEKQVFLVGMIFTLMFFVSYGITEGAGGSLIVENNGWNTNVVSFIGATGSDFYAQSFIANVNAITKFGVVIQEIESQGQVILSTVADNGSGAPDVSAPLYQGTLRDPSTTGAWFYETGISVPLTVGQKYWVFN
jgi:hypothetical protein